MSAIVYLALAGGLVVGIVIGIAIGVASISSSMEGY